MSSSLPVRVAVPSISNFTMLGLVVRSRPNPRVTVWLLRSRSSSLALALKLTVSALPLRFSLEPIKLVMSTLTETLGTCKAGQMVDSPHNKSYD